MGFLCESSEKLCKSGIGLNGITVGIGDEIDIGTVDSPISLSLLP